MQPGMLTEADILAATQSLQTRKDLKLAQMAALQDIQACLGAHALPRPGSVEAVEQAVAVYLGHLITEHGLDAEALGAQIAYNQQVLSALRSSIVLPSFDARKKRN